ncbi:hypothetical protein F5I97DRAFT_1816644 [Phlebopus sp. FC_14]|nr:hypothetical protein F5I97DRAFT_1816644 [Phlebopus sp. FC_14]
MTRTNPPPKIPSVPSGTPASEWASTTQSVLSTDSVGQPPATHSQPTPSKPDVTTPGFPGSYPKERSDQQTQSTQERGETEQHAGPGPSVGTSVVQTAKQYMPSQVERGVEYAGQAAAPYLPQGVTDTVVSYWKHDEEMQRQEAERCRTSLPSTELKGAQPSEHTGGVGALPGTISESSVALLPDERAARDARTPTRAGMPQKETPLRQEVDSPAAASPTRETVAGKDEVSLETPIPLLPPPRPTKSDPIPIPFSTQLYPPSGASPTTDKNKELPPKPSEGKEKAFVTQGKHAGESVAAPSKQTQKEPSKDVGDAEGGVPGVLGGIRTQVGGDVAKETKMAAGAAVGADGYEGDYHPAELHPPPAGASAAEYGQQGRVPAAATSPKEEYGPPTLPPVITQPSGSSGRRVSFMAKVKGEAKIIAGKMSGKEEKVEEGRRMVHGDL